MNVDAPVATRRVDPGSSETPSDVVVALVSETSGRNPRELPRLADVADPDALDALFSGPATAASRGSVAFPYAGYRVIVHHDGTVLLRSDAPAE